MIEKLRQADVLLGKGQLVSDICNNLEITSQKYYRWRQKYGSMAPEMAKELKTIQKENARLKKLFAEQALDMGKPQGETGEPGTETSHGC